MKKVVLTSFLFCGLVKNIQAACTNLNFVFPQTSYSFNVNSSPSLTIRVRRSGVANGCSWFITTNKGASPSYSRNLYQGLNTIGFQIWDNTLTEIIKHIPDATSNADVIEGVFPNGSGGNQINVNYRAVRESPVTYKRFGSYAESLTFYLYEGTITGTYVLKDTQVVNYTQTVAKAIDLSLVDSGAPFNVSDTSQNLNFGTMTSNASQSFDVVLQYNAGYDLKFSSLRQGNLKHASTANLLSYSMSVNSVPVNLVGSNITPVSVSTQTGVSSAAGTRLPVNLTLGSISSLPAGSYSDTISITVQSIE